MTNILKIVDLLVMPTIVDTLTHVQSKNHIRLNSPIFRPSRWAAIVISALTIFTLWIASRGHRLALNVAQLTWNAAISLTSPISKEELAFWKMLSVPVAHGRRPFHLHRLMFAVTFTAGRWLVFSSTFVLDWISPAPFELAQQLKMQIIISFMPAFMCPKRNNDHSTYPFVIL